MEVKGLGIDLAEVPRVRSLLLRHPGFAQRCFTATEQKYAASYADPAPRLAARFAGKEAVMKSLGCGWRDIRWQDIEITGGGAPRVKLAGTALARASALGVSEVLVTITHTADSALVLALALA